VLILLSLAVIVLPLVIQKFWQHIHNHYSSPQTVCRFIVLNHMERYCLRFTTRSFRTAALSLWKPRVMLVSANSITKTRHVPFKFGGGLRYVVHLWFLPCRNLNLFDTPEFNDSPQISCSSCCIPLPPSQRCAHSHRGHR
jgi:hypothetical protein